VIATEGNGCWPRPHDAGQIAAINSATGNRLGTRPAYH
jgi:hypothetical protein